MNWRRRIKGSFEAFGDIENRGGKLKEEKIINKIKTSRTIIENIPIVLKSLKTLKRVSGKPGTSPECSTPPDKNSGSETSAHDQWSKTASPKKTISEKSKLDICDLFHPVPQTASRYLHLNLPR